MIDHPWSNELYDKKYSVSAVCAYLDMFPVRSWINEIQKLQE